ncbi:hypothetical protein SE92_09940 [Bradyrhizobium sp. AT1]|nr:hypothetical protein SE92_09940 [Bradyrhizobium sp. AT1]
MHATVATFIQLPSGNWRVQVRRKNRYVSETFRRRKDGEMPTRSGSASAGGRCALAGTPHPARRPFNREAIEGIEGLPPPAMTLQTFSVKRPRRAP